MSYEVGGRIEVYGRNRGHGDPKNITTGLGWVGLKLERKKHMHAHARGASTTKSECTCTRESQNLNLRILHPHHHKTTTTPLPYQTYRRRILLHTRCAYPPYISVEHSEDIGGTAVRSSSPFFRPTVPDTYLSTATAQLLSALSTHPKPVETV